MMRNVSIVTVMLVLTAGFAFADSFGSGSNQFTIDFVDITGDASSANGTSIGTGKTFVDPGYNYRMGTYEITNDQWNKFKAEYGAVTGDPSGAYDGIPQWTGDNEPTSRVSWYEAAQFVNYLNTSSGYQAAYKFTGTQGTGNYALDTWSEMDAWEGENLYRHKDAQYFLPTEDEWVKAAYWNGSQLQTYATTDGSTPQAGVDSNYNSAVGLAPWNVGSGSEELNGTYNMMGNVWEWVESPHSDENYGVGSSRGMRGGFFKDDTINNLASSHRGIGAPDTEYGSIGFRVASVPEPSSLILLSVAGLFLRKKRS